MEYIKKEELIANEIYKNIDGDTIFKSNQDKSVFGIGFRISNKCFARSNWFSGGIQYLLATSEEKHWLNECIKQDKFITFEEAMKIFIPEYVECIDSSGWALIKKGTIYKTDAYTYFPGKYRIVFDERDGFGGQTTEGVEHRFKPSTKEAYDAQFVVKEPEFVLPEKWYVKANTKEEADIMYPYFNKISKRHASWSPSNEAMRNEYYARFNQLEYEIGVTKNELNPLIPIITFEQFKKYVLKEETPVQDFMKLHDEIIMKDIPLRPRGSVLMDINIIDKEIIEPLPQFKVIETIETITKVENNEGNQFFIGDVVISSNGTIQTIESFDYNKAKTNIIAFTNKQSILGNGIGIDKIEHYIEPKVEVEDDFILPEKWCIKRDFENDKIVTDYINKIASISHNYLLNNSYNPYLHNKTSGCCSYYKVIEDYTEITFDQFKKHVLKEEVKGEIDN